MTLENDPVKTALRYRRTLVTTVRDPDDLISRHDALSRDGGLPQERVSLAGLGMEAPNQLAKKSGAWPKENLLTRARALLRRALPDKGNGTSRSASQTASRGTGKRTGQPSRGAVVSLPRTRRPARLASTSSSTLHGGPSGSTSSENLPRPGVQNTQTKRARIVPSGLSGPMAPEPATGPRPDPAGPEE